MRKKSTYIILIVVLFVFFAVMFLTFGISNIRDKQRELVFLVGDNTIWTYQNKKWTNHESLSANSSLNWQEYNIYLNREKFGKYSLWHDDRWYAFDSMNNAVSLEGDFFAYRSNRNISIYPFQESSIQNYSYVDVVLKENSLPTNHEFTSAYQISFDFDQDGVVEDFYILSNVFPMDFHPEHLFSIAFMVKEGVIYPIYNDIESNYVYNGCKPYFQYFLDVDEDFTSEFIMGCGYYSVEESRYMLYQFQNNEFKILVSNQ